jgi:hypothetical protein
VPLTCDAPKILVDHDADVLRVSDILPVIPRKTLSAVFNARICPDPDPCSHRETRPVALRDGSTP